MTTSKLGISPVSLNVIDAAVQYSKENQVQLMLIASRNQVECAELGKGYVENFSSKEFVDYVRKQDSNNILICRDHSGPYMIDKETEMEPKVALEQALFSIKKDIDAGFDLIHIDCSNHKGDVYQATATILQEIVRFSKSAGRSILFEVGTEINVGDSPTPQKFRADLEFITRLIQPEFVVGQTGSLLKETFQVGYFDYRTVMNLVSLAHSFGIKFKEHNADYSNLADLRIRRDTGVDAINVGPEFGVVQTKTVIALAQHYGFFKELDAFLNRALGSGKWQKWIYGEPSDYLKAVIAGHYVYSSDEYHELVDKLNTETDVNAAINESLVTLIDHYLRGLS